jgi:diacylglycerol kinase family enzyme
MEKLSSLKVTCLKGTPTELILTNNYIYWYKSKKLKSYHIDSLLGIKSMSNQLTLLVYISMEFRFYKFTTITDSEEFIMKTKIKIYPQHKHFMIIYNPISGRGVSKKELDSKLIPILSITDYTYEIYETTENYLNEETISKIEQQANAVIFLSGDGTVHQVITALYRRNPAIFEKIIIGSLQTGSRNALACELNGKSLNQGIYNILKGTYKQSDLIKVKLDAQELIATCAINVGISSEIPYEADKYKILGKSRYFLIGVKKVFTPFKVYSCNFSYVDLEEKFHQTKMNFTGIGVGNIKGLNINNDETPFPFADISNGHMDCFIMHAQGRFSAVKIFFQMVNSGQHITNKDVTYLKFKTCRIETPEDYIFNVDGEMFLSRTAEIEVLPKTIKYFSNP